MAHTPRHAVIDCLLFLFLDYDSMPTLKWLQIHYSGSTNQPYFQLENYRFKITQSSRKISYRPAGYLADEESANAETPY